MPVVLHADAREANRRAVRRMLAQASYDVVEAETGTEALRLAPSAPDLVILDLDLPGLHGLEVCRRLRADAATAGLPIVLLTATYGAEQMWAAALDARADGYLTYPVEPPVLLGTVRSLLRARAARKAWEAAEAENRTLRESAARWRAHFKGGPTPALLWRREGTELVLSDHNDAADVVTRGRLAAFAGIGARALYADAPQVLEAMDRCLRERATVRDRVRGPLHTTGALRTMDVTSAFVPPDSVIVHFDDVTERLGIEKVLRSSERQLRAVFEGVRDGIVIFDDEGNCVEANAAACSLFGVARDQLVGASLDRRLPVADLAFHEFLEELRQDGHFEGEGAVSRPDGSVSDVELVASATFLSGRHLTTMRDVTRRKQTERALEESRLRMEALFANSLDGILLSDDDGRYVDANPAACALLGYTRDELRGLTALDLVVEHMRDQVGAANEKARREGRLSGEWAIRRKDGTVRRVEYRTVADVLPGLRMSSLRDVTGRHEAAERLARRERQLAEAQQIAHLGSWERDLRTSAIVASDELFRIHGVEPGGFPLAYDEFLRRTHPEDRELVAQANRAADAEGRPLSFEARVVRPDGSLRVVSVQGEAVLDEDGRPQRLVGIVQDITERKQVEEQRRALLERILRVQEDERRSLARELHDEVGQSLTALKLMLEARAVPDTAARRRAIRQDAATIVDDLLRRIRNLSLDLRPPMLDDLGLMVALTWHLDHYQQRTGVHVTLTADGVDGRFPSEPETTAFRVVQEALTNVARHSGATEATVEVRADPAALTVVVSDLGRGFDAATVLPTAVGGLAGLRERVGLLGGQVQIVSSVGAGTRVEARIPAETGARGGGPSRPSARSSAGTP